MGQNNSKSDCLFTQNEETVCMAVSLRLRYIKDNQYDFKEDSSFIKFPKHYFEDLKFFLEHENADAVMILLSILRDIPLKKPVGKSELREFKNANIIFMTLFVNVIIEVFSDITHQLSALKQFIIKMEELEQVEALKNLTMDTMVRMIHDQKKVEVCDCQSVVVHKALRIIERDYREKIRLQSLSEELLISENYISKCLKKETGKGFKEHIQEIRIGEAKQLLTKTDASVHDIAISIGFNYQNHFASVFRKYVGTTPLEYRNCHFK